MVIVSTGLLKCWNPNFPGVQFCTWPRWDPSRTEEEVEQSGKFQGNGTSWAMFSWPWFMGIIFSPIWGKQEKRGWEDFRPDSESVFGYVSSWPSRRWYSFGCVGPLMGAGWRFFCIFFLTPKMREVPKTGGTRKKTTQKFLKRNNYCEFRCDSHFWDRQKLKTSWAQDTPPNAIPLADQAGFIKDYQLNHHHPLVRPFFFGIISWVVAFFWSILEFWKSTLEKRISFFEMTNLTLL